MALTKIQRNMIADSAVMPNNIVSTASYSVGALRSTGVITGTNIIATGNLSLSNTITATGGSGLKIENLRSSTSSYAIYYNNSTNEITYGTANFGGGGVAYDQSLNTTDAVKFAQVTATTSLSVGATSITNTGTLRITGVTAGTQSFGLVYNPTSGLVNYVAVPNQTLSTTSSVTFSNLTVTNTLKAGGNIYPTTQGSSGQFLTTNGSGTLSWASQDNDFLTFLGETTFRPYSVETPTLINFKTINNFSVGTIRWDEEGFGPDGILTIKTASQLNLRGSSDTEGIVITTSTINMNMIGRLGNRWTLELPDNNDNVTLECTTTNKSWEFNKDGSLKFPDGTSQSSAAGPTFNQSLNTTNDVTFKSVTVTSGSGVDYSGGVRSTGDLYLFGGSLGYNGAIRMFGSKVEAACSILPKQNVNVDLGSPTQRWSRGWIKTLTVGTNTIYFEDEDAANTSTLSIQTGTVYLDGAVVLDQSVAAGSSPTFGSVAMTTSTVDHIEVSTNFIANSSTVQIYDYTMPTTAATTSGWAMTSNGSGAIEFQPAVLSTNITIDGGFANSVYTAFDYAIDGGGASA